MVTRLVMTPDGTCAGLSFVHEGRERLQRASAVVVVGYAIESPRLLLNSGVRNGCDQVGRYVMVQGALQVAGRFPETRRMHKGPPPEVLSEHGGLRRPSWSASSSLSSPTHAHRGWVSPTARRSRRPRVR